MGLMTAVEMYCKRGEGGDAGGRGGSFRSQEIFIVELHHKKIQTSNTQNLSAVVGRGRNNKLVFLFATF